MTQELEAALNELKTSTPPVIAASPHLEFTEVRNRLLELEAHKKSGKDINLAEVQTLTRRAADLIAIIQTSGTGPKTKVKLPGDTPAKKGRAAKVSKPSTIGHIALPDSFDDL